MRSTFAFGLLAVAGLSAAQEQYTIDPSTVQESTRDYWCQQQKTTCPQICLQQPGVTSMNTVKNDCDADSLTATCICDNGISPNLTQYTQTLAFNICQQWGTNCVKDCGQGENDCANACRADHPCGAQDPYKPNTTTTSTSSSSHSATASASSTEETSSRKSGFPGSSDSDTGAAATLVNFGATYGMAITLVSFFAGFALV